MSEIEEIHTYLKKILVKLENIILESLPPEYHQLAQISADISAPEDLLELSSLQALYRKDALTDRARKVYPDNLALFFKAKIFFEKGELINTIDTLLTYYLQLGRIQQNIIEEDSFKEKESRRSKAGTDKRYVKHQLIRAEACQLLRNHQPESGWPSRPSAAKKILPYLESFVNKLDRDEGRMYFELENIGNVLAGWMEDKKNEVSVTFEETASQKWLSQHVKNKPL